MLLCEICAWKPLPKVRISISDAYFSAAETMADFFNRIGPFSAGHDSQKSAEAVIRDSY